MIHFLCQIHYNPILVCGSLTPKLLIDLLTNWDKFVGQVCT
jgi:hypothetical protein